METPYLSIGLQLVQIDSSGVPADSVESIKETTVSSRMGVNWNWFKSI